MPEEKLFLQFKEDERSSQVNMEKNCFYFENPTFAGGAHLFFQLVHEKSQDEEQEQGNSQCHTQAIQEESVDFAIPYIGSRKNRSGSLCIFIHAYTTNVGHFFSGVWGE